jgi:hypothetical protein
MVIPVVVAAAARVGATTAARAVAAQGARAAAASAAEGVATQGARAAATEATAGTEARAAQGARQTQFQNTNIQDMGGRRAPAEQPRTDVRDGSARDNLPETQSPESEARMEEKRRIDQAQRQMQQQEEADDDGQGGEGEPPQQPYQAKTTSVELIPLLILAVIIDGLQILFDLLVVGVVTAAISYIVGFILGVVAFMTFGLWYWLKGINIFSGRKLVVSAIGFCVDAAFAGLLPVWCITVLFVYFDEKAKERGIDITAGVKSILK